MGEVDNKVKQAVASFEDSNGTKIKSFSVKEIVLFLHKEYMDATRDISKKIDDQIEWSYKNKDVGDKVLKKCQQHHDKIMHDHELLMQEMLDKLPEKGFCERVTNTLWPDKPELPIAYKINTMWHERRLIKYVIYGLFALGIGNILVEVF